MNHGKNVIHNAQDLSGKGLRSRYQGWMWEATRGSPESITASFPALLSEEGLRESAITIIFVTLRVAVDATY